MSNAVKELFGEDTGSSRQKGGGGGGYQSISDFVFYQLLYERFCGYVRNPATLAEDLAPPVVPDLLAEPEWFETPESIEAVLKELKQRFAKLVSKRYKDHESHEEELHEHLFYSQALRRMAPAETRNKDTARQAANLMCHISKKAKSLRRLLSEYTSKKRSTDSVVAGESNNNKQKELTRWLTQQLAMDDLPSDLLSKQGFFVAIVQEHFDHKVNHCGFSDAVRALRMRLDTSNALDGLQKHIFCCYVEAAAVMASNVI